MEGDPKKPDRREFLKKVTAYGAAGAIGGAVGLGNAMTKESRRTEGAESPEALKDRYFVIELEKTIFNSFGPDDLEQMAAGIVPSKVFQLSSSKDESLVKTMLAGAAGAAAAALTRGLSEKDTADTKNESNFKNAGATTAAVFAVGAGLLTGVNAYDFIKQPKRAYIDEAEKEVKEWIIRFNTDKKLGDFVLGAVRDRIEELDDELKAIKDTLSRS